MRVLEVPPAGSFEHQVGEPDDRLVVVRAKLQILLEVKDRLVRLSLLGGGVRLPKKRVRHSPGLDTLQGDQPAAKERDAEDDAQEQFLIEDRHGSPVLERGGS